MLGVNEVHARLAELDKIIEESEAERSELRNLAELLEKYEPKLAAPSQLQIAIRAAESAFGPRKIKTENSSDIAYQALAGRGELHINDIIAAMREAGWQGSGDARKDYKNIHQLLASNTKRFSGTNRGYFQRIEADAFEFKNG